MHCRDQTSCSPDGLAIRLSSYWLAFVSLAFARRCLARSHRLCLLASLIAASQLVPTLALADEGFEFRPYVEGFIAGSAIDVGNFEYYPVFGGVSAGFFFREGIGLELHLDGEILPGEDNDYELAYERGVGAALRFESPPREGLSGYVLLGYTNFSARQERETPPVAGDELNGDFGGPRLSIGLVQRLTRLPSLSITAEYRKYAVQGGLDVDALVLGLRVSQR